jgi:hypothetical protein
MPRTISRLPRVRLAIATASYAEPSVHPRGGRSGGDAIAEALALALPRMIRIWNTRARPFIATVNARGDVTVIEGGARRGAIKRGQWSANAPVKCHRFVSL